MRTIQNSSMTILVDSQVSDRCPKGYMLNFFLLGDLFVWVEALCPSQPFFSLVETFFLG